MAKDNLKQIIEDYLTLIDQGMESVKQNEKILKILLDKIALASSVIEEPFDYDDLTGGSSENDNDLREVICLRFPNYGFYNIPNPISKEIANAEINVGDGIDDLIDITKELRPIIEIWERDGEKRANKAFLAAYQYHLGDHLRCLRYYIHALERDQ